MTEVVNVLLQFPDDSQAAAPKSVVPATGDYVLWNGIEYVVESRSFEYRLGERVNTTIVVVFLATNEPQS